MKKIILLTVSLFLAAGSISLQAGESKRNINEVKKSISSSLSVPDKLKQPDFNASVLVFISIDDNGKVSVLAINSPNTDLRQHVEERLKKMSFKDKLVPGEVYNFKLNFKVI
ncbi:MAG TPA: hypothetical protein VI112_02700 [Bacteroidia bacterium]|jgi:hypothetical protein